MVRLCGGQHCTPRCVLPQIEFRWANQLARAVPLLLTDDPAMAAEMQTVG